MVLVHLAGLAQRVTTLSNGYWSNPAIWSTGVVPASSDSVIIDDYVLLDTNIAVSSTGLLFIDGCGVLCGDFSLSGSFTNYGELRIKTGELYDTSYNYSLYTCSEFNIIYTAQGGWLENCCGGTVYVSYPVNCSGFPRSCNNVLSLKTNEDEQLTYFTLAAPNAHTWLIQSDDSGQVHLLSVFDVYGQKVFESHLQSGRLTIDHTIWPSGIYLLQAGGMVRKVVKR
ncbi:MAG: T9SS type A sorting domain-containing protein [Bacteroidetes bacterium]|nr:T9SS type A sorting domain-containing protein [Bacteroidota bacterium]